MKTVKNERISIREFGLVVGDFPPGEMNSITDVKNVRVGHVSISDGDINTGVTVVLPHLQHANNALYFWGKFILNCREEITGIQVLEDFGLMASPIFFSNSLSVGRVYNAGITFGFSRGKGLPTNGGWPPIVISFDDRILNDMRQRFISEKHVLSAIQNASKNVTEGSIGAGTGATMFGFKGGIGSSSRLIILEDRKYRVGVLTLANYGKREQLRIDGIPVGKEIEQPAPGNNPFRTVSSIVATDAPLTSRQLNFLSQKAALGLMRVGEINETEDSCVVISFSTGIEIKPQRKVMEYNLKFLSDSQLSPLYRAVSDAAEESVLNALFKATTLSGYKNHISEAITIEEVRKILVKFGRKLKD